MAHFGIVGIVSVASGVVIVIVTALAPTSELRDGHSGLAPERIGIKIIKGKGERIGLD